MAAEHGVPTVVYVKGEPIDDDDVYFKRLDPKGDTSLRDIWEIRIVLSPQSRLFGAFADKDCFVAFTGRLRNKCPFAKAMKIVRAQFGAHIGPIVRFGLRVLVQTAVNVFRDVEPALLAFILIKHRQESLQLAGNLSFPAKWLRLT